MKLCDEVGSLYHAVSKQARLHRCARASACKLATSRDRGLYDARNVKMAACKCLLRKIQKKKVTQSIYTFCRSGYMLILGFNFIGSPNSGKYPLLRHHYVFLIWVI
jgi:hypothetical protein